MKPDMEQIKSVKGFLDETEGNRLYELALTAGRLGPILEIGGYCGKSTIYLANACRENGAVLYSVDHHRGSEEQQPGEEYFDPDLFDAKLGRVNTFSHFIGAIEAAGLLDTVAPIVCASSLAARHWSTPLGMVFIDGGHSYAAAYTDYNCWAGHIAPGGFLAIHDIFTNPEKGGQAPYQIYKLAAGSGLFKRMPMTGTLGVLQRRLLEDTMEPI